MLIEPLERDPPPQDVRALAELLVDVVDSGGSVSFMAPLALAEAERWWRDTLSRRHSLAVILVAREQERIVGTVQLQPAWAPNQPHRADVTKLMVHPGARGRGIARGLMLVLEQEATARGFTLLVLDTVRGESAERLYTSMGWSRVGVVPNFALHPDGKTFCDTVFFYKAHERLTRSP